MSDSGTRFTPGDRNERPSSVRAFHHQRECWCGIDHELERRIADCSCGKGNLDPFLHLENCPVFGCGRTGCSHALDSGGVPICGIGAAG